MAKRLQVIIQEAQYREIQRAARARRLSIAEWVRQALESARRREPTKTYEKTMEAVRTAITYEFPTGDIDQMLREIEQGYESDRS